MRGREVEAVFIRAFQLVSPEEMRELRERLAQMAAVRHDVLGHADREPPDFAKPLAPLPEWLEKVDKMLGGEN